MYRLLFSKEAENDVDEAVLWYEEQKKGLGQQFASRLEEALYLLETSPKLYAEIYKNVRSLMLKQFPYLVFFSVSDSAKEVHIFAVVHSSRNPAIWQIRKS